MASKLHVFISLLLLKIFVVIINLGFTSGFNAFLTHTWRKDHQDRNNHDRVARINEGLKSQGITTWFDSDKLNGEIYTQMTNGIEKSQCVVVFMTEEYMNKVNGDETRDPCRFEFNFAFQRHGRNKIFPVLMENSKPEEEMRKTVQYKDW